MTPTNLIEIAVTAFLVGGFSWAVVDLFSRIVKQPKQPLNLLKLSSYPLVPEEAATEHPQDPRRDGLQLQPVPVEIER